MLHSFLKILPWFLVVRIARANCERFMVDGTNYVQPFHGGPLVSVDSYGKPFGWFGRL